MPAAKLFQKPSPRAHHVVRIIHAQMIAEGLSRHAVSKGSGVGHTTIRHWWDGSRSPQLDNVEAVLNFLGLTLKVTPLEPGHSKWIEPVAKPPAKPLYAEPVKKIKLTPRRSTKL